MENNKPKTSKDSYEVGYKKPPKAHQFKPGQSGNRTGRKKKPVSNSLYEAFLIEANAMTEIKNRNGKCEQIKNAEIIMKATFRDAIAKDGPSRKFILEQFLKTDIISGYNHLVDRQTRAEKPDSEIEDKQKKLLLTSLAEFFAQKNSEKSDDLA